MAQGAADRVGLVHGEFLLQPLLYHRHKLFIECFELHKPVRITEIEKRRTIGVHQISFVIAGAKKAVFINIQVAGVRNAIDNSCSTMQTGIADIAARYRITPGPDPRRGKTYFPNMAIVPEPWTMDGYAIRTNKSGRDGHI